MDNIDAVIKKIATDGVIINFLAELNGVDYFCAPGLERHEIKDAVIDIRTGVIYKSNPNDHDSNTLLADYSNNRQAIIDAAEVVALYLEQHAKIESLLNNRSIEKIFEETAIGFLTKINKINPENQMTN